MSTASPLAGFITSFPGDAPIRVTAAGHARRLLQHLGVTVDDPSVATLPETLLPPRDDLESWAVSGGAWLTGRPDGPPLGGPAAIAGVMDGAAAVLGNLSELWGRRLAIDGAALLGERAAAFGHGRRGQISPGGACRLLRAGDGWIALNLPRPDDWELIPALLETPHGRWPVPDGSDVEDGWERLRDEVRRRGAAALLERCRLLGLLAAQPTSPRAAVDDPQGVARELDWPPAPWALRTWGQPERPPDWRPPRVVDLSSLWAGPLASRLLADAGADVVKVESATRPDGARAGPRPFFDQLNHGKASVAVALDRPGSVEQLRRLLQWADIVIEASRPRALDQLGCGPDQLLNRGRRQVWVSVTGYGRTGPWRQLGALGDDAGVAGGLAVWDEGQPLFCADAIADPATGLHAAIIAMACWWRGGSHHADVAMREVAMTLGTAHPEGLPAAPEARRSEEDWYLGPHLVRRPVPADSPGPGPELGADNHLLSEVGG